MPNDASSEGPEGGVAVSVGAASVVLTAPWPRRVSCGECSISAILELRLVGMDDFFFLEVLARSLSCL